MVDLSIKIKEKLKKQNPSFSSDELDNATKDILENLNSQKKVDEDGHIVVAENVKVVLSGNITSSTDIKE